MCKGSFLHVRFVRRTSCASPCRVPFNKEIMNSRGASLLQPLQPPTRRSFALCTDPLFPPSGRWNIARWAWARRCDQGCFGLIGYRYFYSVSYRTLHARAAKYLYPSRGWNLLPEDERKRAAEFLLADLDDFVLSFTSPYFFYCLFHDFFSLVGHPTYGMLLREALRNVGV